MRSRQEFAKKLSLFFFSKFQRSGIFHKTGYAVNLLPKSGPSRTYYIHVHPRPREFRSYQLSFLNNSSTQIVRIFKIAARGAETLIVMSTAASPQPNWLHPYAISCYFCSCHRCSSTMQLSTILNSLNFPTLPRALK